MAPSTVISLTVPTNITVLPAPVWPLPNLRSSAAASKSSRCTRIIPSLLVSGEGRVNRLSCFVKPVRPANPPATLLLGRNDFRSALSDKPVHQIGTVAVDLFLQEIGLARPSAPLAAA